MKNDKVILNRKQAEKFCEVVKQFGSIEHFTIETDSSSGIGTGLVVSFNLFDDCDSHVHKRADTKIDITDVSEW